MYFKRFAQLFVIFLIAVGIFSMILEGNFGTFWLRFILGLIVAYAVLTLPLVILTIAKANKKANIVGTKRTEGELAEILQKLPGYIALSVQSGDGKTATTIMSFVQSQHLENVLYMVSDKTARKVAVMKHQSAVSFTTWFDTLESGGRLSSNQAIAEIIEGDSAATVIKDEPNILSLHENAVNMSIIKLTIQSALYENFKDGLKVLDFEK
ncbi:pyridoxamine 5'-phosphate oxidase family protein [Lactococcus protaetiae]|uniref:Pyridoxamine 5'-phosphate oxidase family protein n=1 Tax=Lactococcus protaetiae TaxID=2592653 RepID=A0A514Z5Y3_9LACT|nr:pyridoxamine 5'-phosphate oxidase family protein [Lactococcus protaetiae]MCL2113025.1 pyridoxamine 5'-phosphate oxidase family protein [Streptococcaceae bacterium]QDK69998.1 pyridoxamine 5'-phosphate oxidase family protein [Lactococcus protaetiae]